jgi:hypothetical protein
MKIAPVYIQNFGWFLYVPGWRFVMSSLGNWSPGWRHVSLEGDSRSATLYGNSRKKCSRQETECQTIICVGSCNNAEDLIKRNINVDVHFEAWRVKPFETHLEGAITRSAALVFGRNLFKIINIETAPYSPTAYLTSAGRETWPLRWLVMLLDGKIHFSTPLIENSRALRLWAASRDPF